MGTASPSAKNVMKHVPFSFSRKGVAIQDMTWKKEPNGSKEERAVSPVIGVILMVAITVILAAVIAAFVMDIGPGGEPVQAALDVSGDGADVEVTITSAENLDSIIDGPENQCEVQASSVDSESSDTTDFTIDNSNDLETGATMEFDCNSGTDQVLQLIGTTDGGGEEILVEEEL